MSKSRRIRNTTVGRIDEEVLAFTAGRDVELDQQLVEVDCLGTAAHVTMLSRIPVRPPILTRDEARQVVRQLAEIVAAWRKGAFQITLEDQDVHLAVERALTEKLGDLGKRVHTARSRNDQIAVDLRLYAREQLLATMEDCHALALALLEFARQHVDLPMVGRTHMQPGMPSSVALWASAWSEELADAMEWLLAVYHENNRSPLGSAAGYGVPLPINRSLVARLLGFESPAHNVLYANQSRGRLESLILDALSHIGLILSRLAQDLLLFTMPEFDYFALPQALCTGSSIMPQKRNPDILELIRAKAARIRGHAETVFSLLRGLPSGYNRDLQEAKEPFFEGFATTRACLRMMLRVIEGLEVKKEAILKGFSSAVFATDRALELVATGMPFRDAYRYVKEHLGELEKADPLEAIRRKRHEGAPFGLDFDLMRGRLEKSLVFVDSERARLKRILGRLMRG